MDVDARWMQRALELAAEPPFTSPNPRVGAVLVRDDDELAAGAHRGPGTDHAETAALVRDARGATLYVTLEPCTHEGRTPPCAPAIVAAGVTRVVVAVEDPDPRVSGAGIAHLRNAGIQVTVGTCAAEARVINAAYFHQRTTGRAFVTLKLALSLDGKLAAEDGTSRWITGPEARKRVHERRVEADAVMVGAGTILADDPELTVREVDAPRQPARVVCDAAGRVPADARVLSSGETIVATTNAAPHDVQTRWKEAGAEVIVLPAAAGGGVALDALLDDLSRRGWVEVYCEGGARLATSLLAGGLVDRLELYSGPVLIGGNGAGIGDLGVSTIGDAPRWVLHRVEQLGAGTLVVLEPGRA